MSEILKKECGGLVSASLRMSEANVAIHKLNLNNFKFMDYHAKLIITLFFTTLVFVKLARNDAVYLI